MIFVSWVILNLLFPSHLISASFAPGTSSSIGVLSTASFPTTAAANLPMSGMAVVKSDCGWHYAAAGSTAPGFYTVPNFGTFNVGGENIGQANVGFNNIGFGNYGTDNTGRLNNGKANIGYLNDGKGNMGALNTGNSQIGDNNKAAPGDSLPCIGYNNLACSAAVGAFTNQSTYVIGYQMQGSFMIGSNSNGSALIGQNNTGFNSIGFQNTNGTFNGNIGVLNVGDGLVGFNNTGFNDIGQNNTGFGLIGIDNYGIFEIGYNNTGNSSIGINQSADEAIGVLNYNGTFLIGFNLTGFNQTGGIYIDTSNISLSEPIIFDPTDTITTPNIGSDFNSQPSELRLSVQNPYIQPINASWQFTLEYPAILTVVDLGCPGDIIQVYDQFSLIMTTSFPRPPVGMNCTGLDSADEALADPNYSRNFITLQPGYHLLTFSLYNSTTGTTLAFKLDSILPPQPCQECEIPVPPLQDFDPNNGLNDLLPFGLPADIHLPENCVILDESSSSSSSSSSKKCVRMNSTETEAQSTSESSSASWCRTKNFQMLRDTFVTHTEAQAHCLIGLAHPSNPADRLEITSLLFKCSPTHRPFNASGGQWIGSDWNGRQGDAQTDCLVAHGEKVMRAKDCNSKRRFICKRF